MLLALTPSTPDMNVSLSCVSVHVQVRTYRWHWEGLKQMPARLGLMQAVHFLPGLVPHKRCAPTGLQLVNNNLLVIMIGHVATLGICNHRFTACNCLFDMLFW